MAYPYILPPSKVSHIGQITIKMLIFIKDYMLYLIFVGLYPRFLQQTHFPICVF
jgi:hypothetical protein